MPDTPERDEATTQDRATHDRAAPLRPTDLRSPSPAGPATIRHDDGGEGASEDALATIASEPRYERRALLGVGGMGEVHLCSDRVIGRDVAMKLLRSGGRPGSQAHARFVREALVQARLEHPAIVPVYDVAMRPDGTTWFTMKRIRGRTLERVLAGLRMRDPEIARDFSRRKLLSAYVQLCLAVDYAHQHGVVHRDLKPGNVMLGDFGEIHVLDWGIAKVAGARDLRASVPSEIPSGALGDLASPEDATMAGAAMGTPGYMSPEQARGDQARVDAQSDVYALGAILYEILTLEPLHRGTHAVALIASSMQPVDARPSARGHDAPPELEAICVRATALDPAARHRSAREIAREVEAYLDGDRDVARRRELAATHLDEAKSRLASGRSDDKLIAGAMQHLGRAVALDPTNAEALGLLARQMVEAPRTISPAAQAELDQMRNAARRDAARHAAKRFTLWGVLLPLVFWMGIREWPVAITFSIFIVASGAVTAVMAQRRTHDARLGATLLLTSSLVVAATAALFGPFVMVPGLAATNAMFFAMNAEPKHRPLAMIAGCATILLPFAIEAFGLVPPAYSFGAHGFVVEERATFFPALPTTLVLILSSIGMVLIPTSLVGRMRDALFVAEERVFLQAWHLRQMLPREAHATLRRSVSPATVPPS